MCLANTFCTDLIAYDVAGNSVPAVVQSEQSVAACDLAMDSVADVKHD